MSRNRSDIDVANRDAMEVLGRYASRGRSVPLEVDSAPIRPSTDEAAHEEPDPGQDLKASVTADPWTRRTHWGRYRVMPRVVLDEPNIGSHLIDVLIALINFGDVKDGAFRFERGIHTGVLENFTTVGRQNLPKHLRELREMRLAMFDLVGTTFTDIRFHSRKRGLQAGLRRRAGWWVRVPVPLIHDQSLTPTLRHAYLCLIRHEYFRRSYARNPPPQFHCTVSLLAQLMQKSHSTAKRALKGLEDEHLIDYLEDAPSLKGARAMRFVPLQIRYAALVGAPVGEFTWRPKFVVRPRADEAVTAWREEGRPIDPDFGLELNRDSFVAHYGSLFGSSALDRMSNELHKRDHLGFIQR